MKTNPENPVKKGITALVPFVKSIVSIVVKNASTHPVKETLALLSLMACLSASAASNTVSVATLEADTARVGVIAPISEDGGPVPPGPQTPVEVTGDMAVSGNLEVVGEAVFAGGPPRLKSLGNLSSGIYGQFPPVPGYSVWFDPMDKGAVTLTNGNEVLSIANKGSDGGLATWGGGGYPVRVSPGRLLYSSGAHVNSRLDFATTPAVTVIALVNTYSNLSSWSSVVGEDTVDICSVRAGPVSGNGVYVPNLVCPGANSGDFGYYDADVVPARVRDSLGPFWSLRQAGRESPFGRVAFGVRQSLAPKSLNHVLGTAYSPNPSRTFLAPGVGDVIIYPTALTDQQVEEAVDWLWAKWGGSLAATKYLVADGEAAILFPDIVDANGDAFEILYDLVVAAPFEGRRLTGFNAGRFGAWGLRQTGAVTLFENGGTPFGGGIAAGGRYAVRWVYNPSVTVHPQLSVLSAYDAAGMLIGEHTRSDLINYAYLNTPFCLFATLYGGAPIYWCDGVGFASVSIRRNGILVSDCVAVEKGSTKWSPTPAPSNCFWDKVTGAYRVQTHGTGSFSIVELAD